MRKRLAVLAILCSSLAPIGEATSIDCFTGHNYVLVLESVTRNGTTVESLAEYEGFALALWTGPPDFFEITVRYFETQGWLFVVYGTAEPGGAM